jgi:hypothetical protein
MFPRPAFALGAVLVAPVVVAARMARLDVVAAPHLDCAALLGGPAHLRVAGGRQCSDREGQQPPDSSSSLHRPILERCTASVNRLPGPPAPSPHPRFHRSLEQSRESIPTRIVPVDGSSRFAHDHAGKAVLPRDRLLLPLGLANGHAHLELDTRRDRGDLDPRRDRSDRLLRWLLVGQLRGRRRLRRNGRRPADRGGRVATAVDRLVQHPDLRRLLRRQGHVPERRR